MIRIFIPLLRCASLLLLMTTLLHADESPGLKLAPRGPAPTKEATPASNPLSRESIRTVGSSLAIVLGLLTLWTAFQRSQQRRQEGAALMQSLGAIQVTPKVKLHVVRLGRRLLVLHLAGGRVDRVAEIDDPDEVAQLLGTTTSRAATVSPRVEELLHAVDSDSARRRFS